MEQRDAKLASLEQEVSATNVKLSAVQQELAETQEQLRSSEKRLDALETYSRRNCLLVNGVPELPDENTDNLVLDLARAAGLQLTADDLDRSHRLGRQQGSVDRPRAIILKLLSYNKRQQFYEARRELSAHRVADHPVLTRHVLEEVYISDFLTSKNHNTLYICRQLKKRGRLWAAYTTNGNIKVRKAENQPARTINDVADLHDLFGIDDRDLRDAVAASSRPATRDRGQTVQAAAAGASPADTGPRPAAGGRAASRGAAQTTGRKQVAAAAAAANGVRKPPNSVSPYNRGPAVDPPTTRDRRQPLRGAGSTR